jgi:hypothetical protein
VEHVRREDQTVDDGSVIASVGQPFVDRGERFAFVHVQTVVAATNYSSA